MAGLGLAVAVVLGWGFFTLPKERWQMVAALPVKKDQCCSGAVADSRFGDDDGNGQKTFFVQNPLTGIKFPILGIYELIEKWSCNGSMA